MFQLDFKNQPPPDAPDWTSDPTCPRIVIPAHHIPQFRTELARSRGHADDWIIHTWGGLGDAVCASPTVRFILDRMPEVKLSVKSNWPELFQDQRLVKVFRGDEYAPNENYYVSQTIHPTDFLQWQFMNHMLVHSVDYISLSILRMQLPVNYRSIKLPDYPLPIGLDRAIDWDRAIVVHAGKHWESKTFPSAWWGVLVKELQKHFQVVLIGQNISATQGYVDFHHDGNVIDLRDTLNTRSLIAVLKRCKALVTNDSAPLHIAASGDASIYFWATVKHADFLMHWRKAEYGLNMHNMSHGSMFFDGGFNFVHNKECVLEKCSEERMRDMLGNPVEHAAMIIELEKLRHG